MFSFPFFKARTALAAILLCGAVRAGAAQDTATPITPAPALSGTAPAQAAPVVAAPAQTAPIVAAPKSKAGEAKKFLALLKMHKVCEFEIDVTVKNETVEEIAARVQKLLPAPAPRIEVRDVRPVRVSFALKNAKVGETLNSAAALGGAQLWVFPDYLLLAPEKALSDAERSGMITWEQRNGWPGELGFSMGVEMQKAFTAFISEELGAKSAGQTTPITMGQLSPDAQEMVRWLVDKAEQAYTRVDSEFSNWVVLSPSSVVEIDTKNWLTAVPGFPPSVVKVTDANSSHSFAWSPNGVGQDFDRGAKKPTPPASPALPPFLDPSAGKS